MKRWKTKSGYEIIQILSGRSNVFLLTNGDKNVLIDTSVSRLWNRLQQRLKKLGINNIDYLFLTHAHFDHAANANRIKSKFNASVIIHKNEVGYLLKGDNILPKGTTFITRPMVKVFSKLFSSSLFKYDPCEPDLVVDSYYDLKDIGFHAYLIHTPGHTIGSMSLIVDDEIAMVGDTMFGVFKWSVFPPYAEDEKIMIKSWGKLLATNCLIFIPSHGTENFRLLVQKDYKKRL
ncbi:MAG: MBL fold metallo-hydrolase [Bacteroidales bacterium]|jgi:glyoxylase-like metal-dependent hydrolase (beta-lactamase superfamily II)|nr:MBL fold metallo-hydrolase [Bacteroidales bacterium]